MTNVSPVSAPAFALAASKRRSAFALPETFRCHPLLLMAKLSHEGRDLLEAALDPLDLRPKHFGALQVLHSGGPMTQQAIAELLRIDRTSMVGLVDDLERAGYAERRPDPCDRRVHRVGITGDGVAALARAFEQTEAVETELFAPLNEGERAQLLYLLRRVCGFDPAPTQRTGDGARDKTTRCAP